MNKKQAIEFKKVIEQFRLIDPEIQAQTILTLINTYLNQEKTDGYSVTDMANELGLSQASASRNVMVWSKLTRKKQAGPDFIAATECPVNRSRKRLSLTQKGINFLELLFPS